MRKDRADDECLMREQKKKKKDDEDARKKKGGADSRMCVCYTAVNGIEKKKNSEYLPSNLANKLKKTRTNVELLTEKCRL